VALYAGGGIARFRPDGTRDGTIEMPCDNITKIVFGDDDRRTAYVTTARKGVAEDVLAAKPLAGGLFRFRVEAPGLKQNLFRP
jgi:sugar lactone lactonase YvrE